MRIASFAIENNRSIAVARCDQVPPLMVIAGPNGSGKTTLLDALRNQPGSGRILYMAPHRTSRRQVVQQRHLLAGPILLEELLARSDTPGYEGISLLGGARDAWNYDDTANYLKHGLCQIELERRDAISGRFDRDGHLSADDVPDPWKPLRDLTSNLLPYLSFERIDASNASQIRCLWRVHGGETLVDLDELSSGEKSIIQMFYPLVEHDIRVLLSEIRGDVETVPDARGEIALLIDEPELHLHPNLQLKVYDYLRLLSRRGSTQLVLATHSPTIVEYATFDELFLLRPVDLVATGENQLVQVASDDDRLAFLRDVFGTTSNLTALQPVVIVEGVDQSDSTRVVSDRKLYRALHPRFDEVTLISGGGKTEVLALLRTLSQVLAGFSPRLQVVALLDRDLDDDLAVQNATLLPVSSIENLLLDPDALWEAMQSVLERSDLATVDDIEAALSAILDELEDLEVQRRVYGSLGFVIFRPSTPQESIPAQVAEFIDRVHSTFGRDRIAQLTVESQAVVRDLKAANRRRELFDGKAVMEAFFQRHLHRTGMSRGIFTFEAARYARRRRTVNQFFELFFQALDSAVLVPEQTASVPIAQASD